MPYNIQTKVVIQSATIELTGQQLASLAAARDAFQDVIDRNGLDHVQVGVLAPAQELLNSIAGLVRGAQIVTGSGKKPLTEAQLDSIRANAAKGRAAMAAKQAALKNRLAADEEDDL